ncbi:MAG: hypothetical protein R6W74_02645 [Nitrosomonas halophila]
MDETYFSRHTEFAWEIAPHGAMRVPAIIYADAALIRAMDDKVYEQICNVATLPGIVKAAYAMPDAHWGAMASRLAGSPHSIRKKAEWSLLAG